MTYLDRIFVGRETRAAPVFFPRQNSSAVSNLISAPRRRAPVNGDETPTSSDESGRNYR
ncbi:hypothetical protein DBV15_08506 [Temnothorax longispinosus]|uniref:Uncharacterized protein n=1 Tax=Temnothorax longispinosus TaxID=300112 RepID=A0A4S2K435_9HYME|nr:hypothetical protein DBV15_08506 [Temnothorax longispinosus]